MKFSRFPVINLIYYFKLISLTLYFNIKNITWTVYTLYSVHSALLSCIVYCVLSTEYCPLSYVYCSSCTVHRVLCTVYCVPCTVHRVLCTVYCEPCAVHSVLCTMYCAPCTVHRVLCTLWGLNFGVDFNWRNQKTKRKCEENSRYNFSYIGIFKTASNWGYDTGFHYNILS